MIVCSSDRWVGISIDDASVLHSLACILHFSAVITAFFPRFEVRERNTLACLACNLVVSFGCIYFGKCRKEFRCQRVAFSTGETTAMLGFVSELRGSPSLHHRLPHTHGNNAFELVPLSRKKQPSFSSRCKLSAVALVVLCLCDFLESYQAAFGASKYLRSQIRRPDLMGRGRK